MTEDSSSHVEDSSSHVIELYPKDMAIVVRADGKVEAHISEESYPSDEMAPVDPHDPVARMMSFLLMLSHEDLWLKCFAIIRDFVMANKGKDTLRGIDVD